MTSLLPHPPAPPLWAGSLLLVGCLHRPVPSGPAPLGPSEIALVHAAPADAPMAVMHVDVLAEERLLRTPSLHLDPTDSDLPLLAARMKATLDAEKGVGIAAPQVGLLRRAVWVQRQDLPDQPFQFYANPRIVAYGAETVRGWEGCLSIPAGYGEVDRPASITVGWQQEDGTEHVETVEGWTARIFQHEVDHLDGVLFTDRMISAELMEKAAYRAMRDAEKAKAP